MLYLPENPDAFKFYRFKNTTDTTQYTIFFGITGATPSTDIGSLIFSYNIEYMPEPNYRPFVSLEPGSGAFAT
jgi:hypothetical protein